MNKFLILSDKQLSRILIALGVFLLNSLAAFKYNFFAYPLGALGYCWNSPSPGNFSLILSATWAVLSVYIAIELSIWLTKKMMTNKKLKIFCFLVFVINFMLSNLLIQHIYIFILSLLFNLVETLNW